MSDKKRNSCKGKNTEVMPFYKNNTLRQDNYDVVNRKIRKNPYIRRGLSTALILA